MFARYLARLWHKFKDSVLRTYKSNYPKNKFMASNDLPTWIISTLKLQPTVVHLCLTYLIPVFEENNFHSQNRVRYVHTGQLKCTWNCKCSRQCLNRFRYIWLAILSYHGNLKPVSDTVNPRAKCHFTWCLPPLIRLSMVSYPDLSRSTGWAVFFLSWRSFTVPLFTRIKVTVCVLGMSAERAYSSAHSSLGKFRKSPQKKLLERVTRMIWTEKKQVYNQTQTSGYIFGLHGEKIIQIVDSFTLQHFVNQKHFFQWVENEGHDIKRSGLERKNIVTSGQILSVVIVIWLPFFFGKALTRASDQVEGCVSNVRWGFCQ